MLQKIGEVLRTVPWWVWAPCLIVWFLGTAFDNYRIGELERRVASLERAR